MSSYFHMTAVCWTGLSEQGDGHEKEKQFLPSWNLIFWGERKMWKQIHKVTTNIGAIDSNQNHDAIDHWGTGWDILKGVTHRLFGGDDLSDTA